MDDGRVPEAEGQAIMSPPRILLRKLQNLGRLGIYLDAQYIQQIETPPLHPLLNDEVASFTSAHGLYVCRSYLSR